MNRILSGECGKRTPGLLDRGESLEGVTRVSPLTAEKSVPESDSGGSAPPAQNFFNQDQCHRCKGEGRYGWIGACVICPHCGGTGRKVPSVEPKGTRSDDVSL